MSTKQTPSKVISEPPQNPPLGNPSIEEGSSTHNFHTQFAFEVNKQIGKLETGVAGMDRRLEKVEAKLDQVQIDTACLKTTTTHIESLLASSVKAIWAIVIVILTGVVGVAVYWVKAKLGI